MAFVWSRLALAAVLAVGGASQAAAAPAAACDEAPRLCCATACPSATIVVDLDDRGADAPLVAPASIAPAAPHPSAWDLAPSAPVAAPAVVRDVLELAPKTSPPRS